MTVQEREANFERAFAEWDERALARCVDFSEHRFVSIERDTLTGQHYVKGHKTMRGACGHLSRTVEECLAYIPESVLDLDSGELHELDVFGHVAPKSVGAVSVMMPRAVAEVIQGVVALGGTAATAPQVDQFVNLLQRALERRSR